MSENQFQFLQESASAVSQSTVQFEDRLIDPRSTRLSRLQAARRFEDQGTFGYLSSGGIFETAPPVRDAQGTLNSGDSVEPIASEISHSFFPYSLSVSPQDILESQSGGVV